MKKTSLLIGLCGLLLVSFQNVEPSANQPNIIYIMADDLGYAELGCYGQQKIKTPNLDKMAAEGLRFTNFYAGSPVCAPSRSVLLTGKHTGHTQVRDNQEFGGFDDENEFGQMPLAPNTETIATMLKSAGYTTACVGKWGLGGPNTTGIPRKHGFDFFYGYLDQKQAHNFYPTHLWRNEQWDTLRNNGILSHPKLNDDDKRNPEIYKKSIGQDYAGYHIRDEAIKFIKDNKSKPFFLYFTPTMPHLAIQVPDNEIDKFGYKFEEKPYFAEKGYTPHNRPRAAYATMISLLDEFVGNIIETLKKEGLDQNTIIFFTSDNGATHDVGGVETDFFRSVGHLRGLKGSVYEGGIRVPMIVKWKGKIKPNTTTNQASVAYDVMPTLRELCKISKPIESDGNSLLPLLMGKQPKIERQLYWEFYSYGRQKAMRWGNWKVVLTDLQKNPNAKIQLYDLSKDESETTDLAAKHPDIVAKMQKMMEQSHSQAVLPQWNF